MDFKTIVDAVGAVVKLKEFVMPNTSVTESEPEVLPKETGAAIVPAVTLNISTEQLAIICFGVVAMTCIVSMAIVASQRA